MTLFYDAANPDNIPAGARACVYADGEFRATPGAGEATRPDAVHHR